LACWNLVFGYQADQLYLGQKGDYDGTVRNHSLAHCCGGCIYFPLRAGTFSYNLSLRGLIPRIPNSQLRLLAGVGYRGNPHAGEIGACQIDEDKAEGCKKTSRPSFLSMGLGRIGGISVSASEGGLTVASYL
jgi:hypothetical protein